MTYQIWPVKVRRMGGHHHWACLCSVPLRRRGGCQALRRIHRRDVLRRRVLLSPSPCRIRSAARSSTAGSRRPGGRHQEGSTRIPPPTASYTLDPTRHCLLYPKGITNSPPGRPSTIVNRHSGSSP
ncbi:hypothetical protein E2562_021541 [Oryza meyeriana var. granulata]|uniref:Uncharacterized protein n=1 Tax=Oryza meyeriana var. granulata TaxID=110450 RepID=A0A6G1EXR8_9ORYZ|nr:hypothetical protein E2562_021541 [Oryza meyeriana var. granulata]